MAQLLDSGSLSAFCEGVAMMTAAGIQTDEAVYLLCENMDEGPFRTACMKTYEGLSAGQPLAKSMRDSGCFPAYALDMVEAGEHSGRLEEVLRSLASYYNEEDRLFAKMRSAMSYPAGLLAVMTVILLFTVVFILPVFISVYNNVSGSVFTGSFAYVGLSMGIGYAALVLMAFFTVVALLCTMLSRGEGRYRLTRIMERVPFSKAAMYQMALSRFTSALATYVSSGVNSDQAMEHSMAMIDHKYLHGKVAQTYAQMMDPENPKSMAQAIYDTKLFDPIYARMMLVGGRSGATDEVLRSLSDTFFDDAVVRIDALIDNVEPALAAFLTIAVGATLVSVMLPLVGVMGSIG